MHHNQIKLCTMPHFDLESPCTQGSSQHNGNVGRVTHNTVSADDLTNEVDMEDLTLGADVAVEPEADVAVEPETDATVGPEADVTVRPETDLCDNWTGSGYVGGSRNNVRITGRNG